MAGVYNADLHNELMKQFGKAGKSNSELLQTNSNKLKEITPDYVAPKTQKEVYDRTPESTRTALKNAGVSYDEDYTPYVSNPKSTAINNKLNTIKQPTIDFNGINDITTGWTLNSGGYGNHYNKQVAGYSASGNAESQRVADSMKKISDMYNAFGDWDSGHLNTYIQNKRLAEKTTNPEELAKLSAINQQLRGFYNMADDIYSVDDLHPISSDLVFGQFLNHGLNKEDRNSIPDITSSDMDIDPKFEMARMIARSQGMYGYEPLGQIKRKDGTPWNDGSVEREMISKLQATAGTPQMNGILVDNNSTSTSTDLPTNTEAFVPITPNGDGFGKTNDGKFFKTNASGQQVEISEDEYNKQMELLLGF